MNQFIEFCKNRGQYKLRIYLKPEYGELATAVTKKSGEPFVDRYSSPKLDSHENGTSHDGVYRLVKVFLDTQFIGMWKSAFLYKANEPNHLQKWLP